MRFFTGFFIGIGAMLEPGWQMLLVIGLAVLSEAVQFVPKSGVEI